MSRYWAESRVHALNNSLSKQTYSFDRSSRFSTKSKNLCDNFYESKNQWKTQRGAGIGKGYKSTLGIKNGYPSPAQYSFDNYSKTGVRKIIGGKMGLSRQNLKYGGIFQKSDTPEPGRYDVIRNRTKSRSNSQEGYTMRAKNQELQPSYMKAPGPGQYKTSSTISSSGIYSLSNFTNCRCPKIKPSKQYDASKYRNFPAPNHYNQSKQNLNETGKYFLSKYQSSRCRSFSRSKNQPSFIKKNTQKLPSPNSYNYFSQFGRKQKGAHLRR